MPKNLATCTSLRELDLRDNPDLGASLWRCQKDRLDGAPYNPKQETPRSWTGKPFGLVLKMRRSWCAASNNS